MDITTINFELQCQERFKKYLELARPFYRENPEYYHTFDHIKDCFFKFVKYEAMFDEQFSDYNKFNEYNKDQLFWAIAFHDACYVPGFAGNEEISEKICEAIMVTNSNMISSLALNTIKSTEIINTKYDTPCERIMHDLDYSCFISAKELEIAEKKIYNEYIGIHHLEDTEIQRNFFKDKRLEFYNTILKRLTSHKYPECELFYTSPYSGYNHKVVEYIAERCEALLNI